MFSVMFHFISRGVIFPVQVIVIENSQDMLNLFQQILSEEGINVFSMLYPVKDILLISDFDPDIIILEYQLGHPHDGWALLEALKTHDHTSGIPIIICTVAMHMIKKIGDGLLDENVTVIAKPFSIDELLESLQTAYARK
jgi:DNA-binding response OmpR family regulator